MKEVLKYDTLFFWHAKWVAKEKVKYWLSTAVILNDL